MDTDVMRGRIVVGEMVEEHEDMIRAALAENPMTQRAMSQMIALMLDYDAMRRLPSPIVDVFEWDIYEHAEPFIAALLFIADGIAIDDGDDIPEALRGMTYERLVQVNMDLASVIYEAPVRIVWGD